MRFVGILGIIALLGIAFLMSNNKRKIKLRIVIWGLFLQIIFAAVILGSPIISFLAMLILLIMVQLYLFKGEINQAGEKRSQILSAIYAIVLSGFTIGLFYLFSMTGVLGWIFFALLIAIILKAVLKKSRYQRAMIFGLLSCGYVWLFTHNITGELIFQVLSVKVEKFLGLTDLGSEFIFGNLAKSKYFFSDSDTWPGFGYQFGSYPRIPFFSYEPGYLVFEN